MADISRQPITASRRMIFQKKIKPCVGILLAFFLHTVALADSQSMFKALMSSVKKARQPPVVWTSASQLSPKVSFSIEHPEALFSHNCANPTVAFVIPTTLNRDNYDDFIIHYTCKQEVNSVYDDTQQKNSLAALISTSETTYQVANEEVFGSKLIGLGGATRKYVARDINTDGYEDYFFATNSEDGRSSADSKTLGAKLSGLMSDGLGKYNVIALGEKGWGHSVVMLAYETGAIDIVHSTYTNNSQAFRFQDGEFADVTDDYPQKQIAAWANAVVAINEEATTSYIVGTDFVNRGDFYDGLLRFHQVDSPGKLIEINYLEFNKAGVIDWVAWNGTPGKAAVIEYEGKLYIGGRFYGLCNMDWTHGTSGSVVVGNFNMQRRADGVEIKVGDNIGDVQRANVNVLRFYAYDDAGMYEIPSPIINEVTDVNYNFYDCRDVNGDDLDDIVVYKLYRNAKPIVYLNDGNGSLVLEDVSSWPEHSSGSGPFKSLMHDINNDDVEDLLQFGMQVEDGRIEIHLMRRDGASSPSPQASTSTISHGHK